MPLRLLTAALVAATAVPAFAQDRAAIGPAAPTATAPALRLDEPLPRDPDVTVGTLDNGLRYYIRRNATPERRAELRLVVDVGSILEDDDQLGLAHFVEHTAFNGTAHFPKHELVGYLESIGVRFGADLNASTGFDQTIYNLPIPTDSAPIIGRAFQILEDWAHGQIFDSAAVADERGVVLEEWRGNQGANARMRRAWLPVALQGSRYAARLPIGTPSSIELATPSRLRRFYERWYRPDLMTVIAVGDFDPAQIEELIRAHFAGIPRPADPRPRFEIGVPNNATPLVSIATDKEATRSNVELFVKLPHESTRTIGDFRRSIAEGFALGMLNDRLAEVGQQPDAPFLRASAARRTFFARSTDAFSLAANVKEGQIDGALESLVTEARRVEQFGFLQTELDRQKQSLLRAYERAYAERAKANSAAFVGEYVDHTLDGEAIPSLEYRYDLVQRLIPEITLAYVDSLAQSWITPDNRVIIAQSPDKPKLRVPSDTDLLAAVDRASAAPTTAYTETFSDEPLVDQLPAPGRIVSEQILPQAGLTEWKLSNGARVLIRPTDFKADELLFAAYAWGGTSLATDADFPSASQSAEIASLGGLGKFNSVDIDKKLAGKAVSIGTDLDETGEIVSGRASPKDFETFFQLIHLEFTGARLDTTAFRSYSNKVVQVLANRGATPEQVMADTVQVTMAQHHPRALPLTAAGFAEVDPARALTFYRDRFADAGNFTFVFVGNVGADTLRPFVERYIASLPATGRNEHWTDIGITAPSGIVERVVRKGVEPKATTLLVFTGPFNYVPENRFALQALIDVFQLKLIETLREQQGGSYSPIVGGGSNRIPRPGYAIQVRFVSSPENAERLTNSVFGLIDSLQANGPSAAEIEKVKEQMIRGRQVQLKQNLYWLRLIIGRDQDAEPVAGALGPYDEMIRNLTPAQVQEAARQYFSTSNYGKFLLLPETPASTQ